MSRLAVVLVFALAALGSLGWFLFAQSRSGSSETPPPAAAPPREEFAAGRDAGFDAEKALGYIGDLCKIGPRISGSEGMRKQQELLKKHFEANGGRVELQRFTARQKSQDRPTEMANLIASWFPERNRRIILCSHYDTRPIADQEPDRNKWHEPFLSANDGTSGTAFLMEFARHVKDLRPEVGIDFVLFDGEEYIFDPEGDQYFFGSDYFAKAYRENRARPRYLGAVLLDMIAGKNVRFPMERNSLAKAGPLVAELWQIAAVRLCPAFVGEMGPEVRDDHLALNRVGIPAVDLIDFTYPHWHRLTDLPENCSADSLAQVGRVLVTWVQRVR